MGATYTPSYVEFRNAFLEAQEGYKSMLYLDTSGYVTTGFGLALQISSGLNQPIIDGLRSSLPDPTLFNEVVTAIDELGHGRSALESRFQFEIDRSNGSVVTALSKFLRNPGDPDSWIDIRPVVSNAAFTVSLSKIGDYERTLDRVLNNRILSDVPELREAEITKVPF